MELEYTYVIVDLRQLVEQLRFLYQHVLPIELLDYSNTLLQYSGCVLLLPQTC